MKNQLITNLLNLSPKDRTDVLRKVTVTSRATELPEGQRKLTDQELKKLHEHLVSETIKFLKDNNLEFVDCVSLVSTGLTDSIRQGIWTPSTDSSLTVEGIGKDESGFSCYTDLGISL